jgi:FtsP/CotA-like multicopper oxidase with cupredoxin domain
MTPGRLSRRVFLGLALASAVSSRRGVRAQTPPLRAAPASVALAAGAPRTPEWAFDGAAPGPELRGGLGESLALTVENALPRAISMRVFGLRGQSARVAIPAGGRGALRAAPPDAGTFWYAAEDRLADPRARGLVGAFVVEEPEEHAFDADRDLAVVLDAWPIDRDGRLTATPAAATLLANGDANLVEPAHPGERLRLRLINAAPDRRFRLVLKGWTGWLVALDGFPLAAVETMSALDLWPGQRADVVVDAPVAFGATAALADISEGEPRTLARFVADGEPLDPLGYAPSPLAASAMPSLGDIDRAMRVGPEIFAVGAPAVSVAHGATMRLALPGAPTDAVLTVEGTAVRRLDGPAHGPWRDVVGLPAGAAADVAFVAATPGDWTIERRALDGSARQRAILRVASSLPR